MIKLNLISPEQKNNLRYEFVYLGLRQIIFSVIAVTILVSTVFLTARIMLEDNYVETIRQTTLVNQKNINVDTEIAKINATLRQIKTIQSHYIKWSNTLIDFSQAIPPGITVSSLAIEKNANTMYLKGNAKTREDLVNFESSLKSKPYLSDISIPISSKLSPVNIDFEINASIDFNQK